MGVADAVFGATAAVVATTAVYKLLRTRSVTAKAASYALVCCLTALAIALALQVSVVAAPVDRLGGPDFSQLVAVVLAITGTCAYQILMLYINDPQASARRRVRPRVLSALVASGLAATLFQLSPASSPGTLPADVDPFGAGAVVVYVTYMGIGAFDIARLAIRFTRLGDRNLLRLGLYMVSGGAYVTGLYAVLKIVFVVLLATVDPGLITVQFAVTRPLVIVASLLASIGSTLPSWGRWVGAARPATWLGLYMSYLTLYPLWRELTDVMPAVALDPRSRWADRLLPTDIRYRLTRRVIEIRDGMVLLRSCRDPGGVDLPRRLAIESGLRGVELAATVEAAQIAMALVTKATVGSVDATAPVAATMADPADAGPANVGGSVGDEVSWLARVTHAFRHSPVVRAARAHRLATLTRGAGQFRPAVANMGFEK